MVAIYFPTPDIFKGNLPAITDVFLVPHLLSPTVQWQLLTYHYGSKSRPGPNFVKNLSKAVPWEKLPDRHTIARPKPANFKRIEAEFAAGNWRLLSKEYMTALLEFLFLKNEPTR